MSLYRVEIRMAPAVRLAALGHKGPYTEIGRSFERLFELARPLGVLEPGTRCFAVYYDDPERIAAEQLRSDAAIAIGPGREVGESLHVADLPGGRCASILHKGPYAEIGSAYRWLRHDWLPASGETEDSRPCFDEYLNDPSRLPPSEWLTQINFPVAPRARR